MRVATSGQTVQVALALSGAVTVDTSGGAPTLTLSNGATATYDAAASSAAGHVIVFDYTPGAGDLSPNLMVTSVNPNGASIHDANRNGVDFSRALNQGTGLQIGEPLTVTAVKASRSGEVDAGQTIVFTVTMSESLTYLSTNYPFLVLSDGRNPGGTVSGNQVSFSYTVGANDHASNLTITGMYAALNGNYTPLLVDSQGYAADLSGAMNIATGLQINAPLYVTSIGSPSFGDSEIDAGHTLQFTLNMSEAVNVAGAPTLALSDGATAVYDAGASDLANGVLTFDYAVGVGDASPNLAITAVNLNGGAVTDAHGNTADFSAALNAATLVPDRAIAPDRDGRVRRPDGQPRQRPSSRCSSMRRSPSTVLRASPSTPPTPMPFPSPARRITTPARLRPDAGLRLHARSDRPLRKSRNRQRRPGR